MRECQICHLVKRDYKFFKFFKCYGGEVNKTWLCKECAKKNSFEQNRKLAEKITPIKD